MKRCPKCNRPFTRDTQKFCTQDGTALIIEATPSSPEIDLKETIRIDSAGLAHADLDDDFETKAISRSGFDPYKTTVSTPQETISVVPVDTSDLRAPATPPPVDLPVPPPSGPLESAPPSIPEPSAPPPSAAAPLTSRSRISIPTAATTGPEAIPASTTAPVVPPPAKRSRWPLVIGILAVLLLLALAAAGAGYWFVVRPLLEKQRAVAEQPSSSTHPRTSTANTAPETKKNEVKEIPPYKPPLGAVEFVNSSDNLDGKLKEHYVDFSFYYPETWHKDPEAGTAKSANFAKMQSQLAPDAPQEIFAVGWYESTGAKETDQQSYPRLVSERSGQFAKTYPEYQKVSEGPTKAGPYDGYEFRFKGMYRNTERGDITIWGRVIFVPPLEGKKGVTLLMLASSLAPGVKSVNDVGVKGELPMMLASFRFGK